MQEYWIGKNQTALKISVSTQIDLTGATLSIGFKKPSGDIFYQNATISGTDNDVIEYNLLITDTFLNEVGTWTIWSHSVFTDGRIAYGEPEKLIVHEIGSLR